MGSIKPSEELQIESIKLTLSGLQNRSIPLGQVIPLSLSHFTELASIYPNPMDLYRTAALFILAYIDLGFSYMEHKSLFDSILSSAGYSASYIADLKGKNPPIPLSKSRIRSLLGRWPASPYNSHTSTQAVAEICALCAQQKTGLYEYFTARKDGSYITLFHLSIEADCILLQDVLKNKYYTLVLPPSEEKSQKD